METLKKLLPLHLRDRVQQFTGALSEEAKADLWKKFRDGDIDILCATEAAGMGCNVPNVQFVGLFVSPRTLAVLIQRWGRAARWMLLLGICFLFVQAWVFYPKQPPAGKGKKKKKKNEKLESRAVTEQRSRLDPALVELVNLEKGACAIRSVRTDD